MNETPWREPASFEEALERLEAIVRGMEEGELALDQAIEAFEEGMRLARFCRSKLDEAQKRIDILVRDEKGGLKAQPFAVDE